MTYAALTTLGAGFRIETDVLGDGRPRRRRRGTGDLVLQGYGDPTLTVGRPRARSRAQVRGDGIRRVTGAIVGDE